MATHNFIDIPRLRAVSLPCSFSIPKSSSPFARGRLTLHAFLNFLANLSPHTPTLQTCTCGIAEYLVCDNHASWMISGMETIRTRNQEVRTLEESPLLRPQLSGIKCFNMKGGTCGIRVNHAAGTLPVTCDQVVDVVDGLLLYEGFNPSAAPSAKPVDWSCPMLLPLEVHSDLQGWKGRRIGGPPSECHPIHDKQFCSQLGLCKFGDAFAE